MKILLRTIEVVRISLLASLILGCATAYKPNGFSGGYSETQLDDNVFKVTFRGNGHTGIERAPDFALLRCAEIALQYGYEYFQIIEVDKYTSQSTFTTPTQSKTTGQATTYGRHTYGTATTTTTGGQTYTIAKPRATNTIVCFGEKPPNGFAYNAGFVFQSISEKYGIKKATK